MATVVYHAQARDIRFEEIPEGVWPDIDRDYALVAIVNSDNLDVAYTQTNHIHQDWTINEAVFAFPGRHRSTSVGDVFMTEEGKYYQVAGFGFKPVTVKPRKNTACFDVKEFLGEVPV